MQEFTTQFKVIDKQENIDGDGALQFTLTMLPDGSEVSGQLIVTTVSTEDNSFFETGELYDVVITPHVVE